MTGLVFVKTKDLETIVKFYIDIIGCTKWISQPDVEIVKHDNFIIGFHASDTMGSTALFSLFYETKTQLDTMFEQMKSLGLASSEPKENTKYKIYNFFARDVEGRKLEFQTFLHELPPI